jgi:tRNA dimethylallyltransferase
VIAYLRGRMALEEARAQMKRLTRRFVRHQANWFKENDPSIHWFEADQPVEAEIEALIRSGKGWIPPGTPLEA